LEERCLTEAAALYLWAEASINALRDTHLLEEGFPQGGDHKLPSYACLGAGLSAETLSADRNERLGVYVQAMGDERSLREVVPWDACAI
jgi:hypothetical protein